MNKRTLKDSPIDLDKVKTAENSLGALSGELRGIKETVGPLREIWKSFRSLKKKVQGAEKLVRCTVYYFFYSAVINGAQERGFLKHYI